MTLLREQSLPYVTSIAFLMAFIAGYIDVTCFIAINHLFTAHVTGNIVIAIAELFHRDSGVMSKLAAIPLFIIIVSLLTWFIEKHKQTFHLLIALFFIEAILLFFGMYGGVHFFNDASFASWSYFIVGMIFIAAMAIHNTLLRTYMSKFPPCTVMTGNLTQFVIDLTTYSLNRHSNKDYEKYKKSLANIKHYGNVLIGFTLGGAIGVISLKLAGFLATGFPIAVIFIIIIKIYREHRVSVR